jgi:AraC family transcriptional activator of pobA
MDKKILSDLPLHKLQHTDFYASATDAGSLGDHAPHHRIDFFAIVWFGCDAGSHAIDYTTYPIQKNAVYLLARHQIHALPQPVEGTRVIIFNKAFFDCIKEDELRFLFAPIHQEGLIIPDELLPTMFRLFELILLENRGKNDQVLLHLYLSAFLLQLYRLNEHALSGSGEHDQRLFKLLQLLAEHCKTQKMVRFYADQVGLTSKRLNQIVKDKMNISVSELIYNYVLIAAKREVSEGKKSIKEIAIDLGFSSQSYFSRFFKKQTGTQPELFRQKF